VINIGQSVHYYRVRNAARRFVPFDGTAFLIRALGAIGAVCKHRGRLYSWIINFEPGGPLAIFRAAFSLADRRDRRRSPCGGAADDGPLAVKF
jgi:hypothetical protein